MSIPHEMRPSNIQTGNLTSDPYFCGNPGGLTSITAEGGSSWNVNPPTVDYNWVAPGGKSCSSTSQCSGSEICGTASMLAMLSLFK